jgi:nucleoside-diphosphate-sugar epimerase
MKIALIGCGWFGSALAKELCQHELTGTTQKKDKLAALESLCVKGSLLNYPKLPASNILEADCIVLNIPPFQGQLEWFQTWPWKKHTHLVFISSISVFGQTSGCFHEEDIPLPITESAHILFNEEKWVRENFASFSILRFGGLVGPNRHPGRSLSGRKNLGSGYAPVNLIHLEDCVCFTKKLIEGDIPLNHIYHLVSDEHTSRREFYTAYCLKHELALPHFLDEQEMTGKIILNEKMKRNYQLKVARMIERSL